MSSIKNGFITWIRNKYALFKEIHLPTGLEKIKHRGYETLPSSC